MPPLMQMPAYSYPQNALLDFSPIERAIERGDQRQHQNKLLGLQQQKLGIEQQRFGLEKQQLEAQQARQKIEQIAGLAAAADRETDPARRQMIYKRALEQHPDYAAGKLDRMYIDPINGPKLLMAEAAKYQDPLARQKMEADIGLDRARARYYDAAAQARAPAPAPAASPVPTADPLEGYGLDDDGNFVPPRASAPRAGEAAGNSPWQFPGQGSPVARGFEEDQVAPPVPPVRRAPLPGMMYLGGPRGEPESPRPAPRGVQVAQVGGGDGRPPLMAQAVSNPFGPAGVKADQVPGIVTTGGNRATTDAQATRAAEGQRAYDAATPEQQDRLRRMRQEQAFWSQAYGRPARAGHYYASDGREMPLAEKNYKGDREQQGLISLNLNKIDEAYNELKNQTFGYVGRGVSGTIGWGENARAFGDLKQAAMNIAYVLSGKTVGKAEFENFMDAYAPKPWDSVDTMGHKVKRMKEFFTVLQDARKGGLPEDQAWARASTRALGVQPDNGTKRDPNMERMRNKYGLE